MMNDSVTVKAKLLVDSGASHGLVLEPDSDPKLKVPPRHIKSIIGRGIGGIITGQIGRIKAIDIGDYTIPNVISNFPDPNSYMDTLKTGRAIFRNGSIGGEILSRFSVVFDFPKEKMYFKRNHDYKKKFYYNLSGLTLKAEGSSLRKYEITDVREQSVADLAGLQSGDIVLSVNNILATDLELNTINSYFNSKPGKKVVLEIERAGKRIKKVFHLENQI
jgi:hypothetical protein